MNVNPGELNKRIKIQRWDRTKDVDGYYTEVWETVCEPWAGFSRLSVKETGERNADTAEVNVRFLIRYRDGINRKQSILYRNNRYEILALNDYGDNHEYMEIQARLFTTEAVS